MTSIVAIACTDGAVIGSDSAATLSEVPQLPTVETPVQKVEIVNDHVIIVGTGESGLAYRFTQAVNELSKSKKLAGMKPLEIAKTLCVAGIQDFQQTNVEMGNFGAVVAFPAKSHPMVWELAVKNFQPEPLQLDKIWFTSMGRAKTITDTMLTLWRDVFWSNGPPNLRGGIFTAIAALDHAIKVNPSGVNGPVQMAVLERVKGGQYRPRMLEEAEIDLHRTAVDEAYAQFASFKENLEAKGAAKDIPKP